MREVDSSVLRGVAPALGIGNPVTAVEQVQFDDAVLQQVLDVGPLIRRGGTVAQSQGIFSATVADVHVGAGAITVATDPYAPASPGAGYPSPVPTGFDFWLLGSNLSAASGVPSATNSSRHTILHPGRFRAFGAVAPTNYSQEYKVLFGTLVLIGTGSNGYVPEAGTGQVRSWGPAIRIPRGASIQTQSVAAGAGTMTHTLLLGLFPSALGQDAVGAG